ncbi:MAG TPA: DUF222 domain-containing protein [Acidimicrobiales bacterium]|nr:DUF222 domain-containing protein [Acidimicrobiales bacterium]
MFGTGDALTNQLRELESRQRALDAERAELLAEWVRSEAWANDGSATPAGRLARETAIAGREARERVKVAGLLATSMPLTRAVCEELGWPKVRLLANAIDARTAEAFAAHEEILIKDARRLSVDQLVILLAHWRRLVDHDGANADADAKHEDDYLQIAESFDGVGFVKGRFGAEATAVIRSVLNAIADELHRAERREQVEAKLRGEEPAPMRTSSERAAAAAVEMAKRAAAVTAAVADGVPVVPARPLVLVTIDADLVGESIRIVRARLASGAPLPLADAERLACDAAVARVVVKDGVVPLELGRTVRSPSEGQRRALSAIWSTCAHPSCDRPFAWCELHHVHHWERGGRTDVGWLLPLCSTHHHLHHKGMFEIERRPDDTFFFRRADGTPIGAANPTLNQLLWSLHDLSRTIAA